MKYIFLLLLCFDVIHAMDDTRIAISSNRPEEEELSRVVVSFYFSQMSPRIIRSIYPRVQEHVRSICQSDHAEAQRVRAGLRELRASLDAKLHPSVAEIDPGDIHGQHKELHAAISALVAQSIEDSMGDLEAQLKRLEEQNKRKERQKRIAIVCGLLGSCISAVTALVTNFLH